MLFLAFAEAIHKSFEGDDAADNIVAGLFNEAGSARAEGLEGFVAAFLQGDHQAERRRRAARSRRPLLLDCGRGTGAVLRRASQPDAPPAAPRAHIQTPLRPTLTR